MAKKKSSFDTKAAEIAKKQGIPLENAKAILAHGAMNASKKAIKANPNLKNIPAVAAKIKKSKGK